MAKKKRKQFVKLNNQIRNYFKGLSFEEGVATLDEDVMVELCLLLNIPSLPKDKEEMIRTLRRGWSDGGVYMREMIVSYFRDPVKYSFLKKGENVVELGRVDHILFLLNEIKHTKTEESWILESFIDTKTSKITSDKIHKKLLYLRMKGRIEALEKALGVSFTASYEMSFYQSFLFRFRNFDFNKQLRCLSEVIDLDALKELDDTLAVERLTARKVAICQEKQQALDLFLENITQHPHPYLKKEEIITLLKGMHPDELFDHIALPFETVERIVHTIDLNYHLFESIEHFMIEKERRYLFWGVEFVYMTSLSYEKRFFYNLIWRGEELTIKYEFDEINSNLIAHFHVGLEEIEEEMRDMAGVLALPKEIYHPFILRYLHPQILSSRNLKIKEKTKRRILFDFGEYLHPLFAKQQREELLAKTIRDFKELFPLARQLKRKIIFHAGPTNSGKTYTALKRLKEATTGYYLAPLRLLALEGYENLKNEGVCVSLITGEEEMIDEESTHISSTIEMMNLSVDVDVCVIDEIQMIADRDRGWAWANALIGVPSKVVILTGSADAIKAIQELCDYLSEPLEIIMFERKNPLELMRFPVPLKHIEPKTAVVAFSRREVLGLKQELSQRYRVSVVYGNLSPEVRREEARRFRDGESEVLVATDAIAMGLNLPIKTLLFAKDNKFDGLRRRELTPAEVKQIAGRAGRYGIEEQGFVGAIDENALHTISRAFHASLPDLELPFSVMASLEHVMLIGEILETENILEILSFFAENMEFEGPFVAANIDAMLEIASIVSEYVLDLKARYFLTCAPVSIASPYIESVFHRYIRQIEAGGEVRYIPPRDLPAFAQTNDMLLNAEDRVREISLYLWLSFKFPDVFKDTPKAIEARSKLNGFIERSLQQGHFTKNCRKCGKVLDFSYRFSICDACHSDNKKRRGVAKWKR